MWIAKSEYDESVSIDSFFFVVDAGRLQGRETEPGAYRAKMVGPKALSDLPFLAVIGNREAVGTFAGWRGFTLGRNICGRMQETGEMQKSSKRPGLERSVQRG